MKGSERLSEGTHFLTWNDPASLGNISTTVLFSMVIGGRHALVSYHDRAQLDLVKLKDNR
jgi:hypothetical protein